MSIFLKTQSLKSTFSHGLNFGLYKEKKYLKILHRLQHDQASLYITI